MALPARFHLEEHVRRRRRACIAARLGQGSGLRVLGHGAYSTTFALGRSKVLKISDARDDTVIWFGRWSRRFPNPHWPRISRQICVGRYHFASWIERLYPLDRIAKDRVSYVDDFVSCAHDGTAADLEALAEFGFQGPWEQCPKRLRQPLLDCRCAARHRGFLPDAKREAFMRRKGGILVLADPFVPPRRAHRGCFL